VKHPFFNKKEKGFAEVVFLRRILKRLKIEKEREIVKHFFRMRENPFTSQEKNVNIKERHESGEKKETDKWINNRNDIDIRKSKKKERDEGKNRKKY
jgi:hypothetical protein